MQRPFGNCASWSCWHICQELRCFESFKGILEHLRQSRRSFCALTSQACLQRSSSVPFVTNHLSVVRLAFRPMANGPRQNWRNTRLRYVLHLPDVFSPSCTQTPHHFLSPYRPMLFLPVVKSWSYSSFLTFLARTSPGDIWLFTSSEFRLCGRSESYFEPRRKKNVYTHAYFLNWLSMHISIDRGFIQRRSATVEKLAAVRGAQMRHERFSMVSDHWGP